MKWWNHRYQGLYIKLTKRETLKYNQKLWWEQKIYWNYYCQQWKQKKWNENRNICGPDRHRCKLD